MRASVIALLLLVAHLLVFSLLSLACLTGVALFFEEESQVFDYFFTSAIVGVGLSLAALVFSSALYLRGRLTAKTTGGDNRGMVLLDFRMPVPDSQQTAEALRRVLADGHALTGTAGSWVLALYPVLPPGPKPADPLWTAVRESSFDPVPEVPVPFRGGLAFRDEGGFLRVVVTHPSRHPVPGKIADEMRRAAFRVLGTVRPDSVPDLSRPPIRDEEAPEDLSEVLTVARGVFDAGRLSDDDIPVIAAAAVIAVYLSAIIGTVLTFVFGLVFFLSAAAGLVSGAGIAVLWSVYRLSLQSRLRMHGVIRGRPVSTVTPVKDVAVLGAAAVLFPAIACACSGSLQWIAGIYPGESETPDWVAYIILLGLLTFLGISAASVSAVRSLGMREADRIAGLQRPDR